MPVVVGALLVKVTEEAVDSNKLRENLVVKAKEIDRPSKILTRRHLFCQP